MSDEVVIGIDAGTTSTKFVALDRSGQIVAAEVSGPIVTTEPEPGASVQAQSNIWAAFTEAVRNGVAELSDGTEIVAMSIAAQSGSVVAVDEVVSLTWMDSRSEALVAAWDTSTRQTIRQASGWMPLPGLGLSTISWLRSQGQEPKRWASVDDFLVNKLTGKWVTNPSNACGMQLMDIETLGWNQELCSIASVDPDELSSIAEAGTSLGNVPKHATEFGDQLGDAELFVGGHDQAASALALGVTEPGSAFLSMGTAWVLTIVTDWVEVSEVPEEFNLSPHIVADRWTLSQNLGGLGTEIAASLRGTKSQLEKILDRCVAQVANTVASAQPICELTELVVVGGATKSSYLLQELANQLDIPVVSRPDASWPALGAALVAASGCGWESQTFTQLPSERYLPNE